MCSFNKTLNTFMICMRPKIKMNLTFAFVKSERNQTSAGIDRCDVTFREANGNIKSCEEPSVYDNMEGAENVPQSRPGGV